jgi:hypothetical protein
MNIHPPTAVIGVARKNSLLDLLTARAVKPVRIPPPIIAARPVFHGNKSYLRALRAAEMKVWNACIKLPTSIVLLFATLNADAP